MGHEAVGTVERVGTARHGRCGPATASWRRSTSRAAPAGSAARGRPGCARSTGSSARGPFGGDLPGRRRSTSRVPIADVNLLPVPDAVDDERALFVGDVLTTGVYAASLADAAPDDAVAVIGAGPVGYCVALALRAAGTDDVFVARPRPAPARARSPPPGGDPVDIAHAERGDGAGARDGRPRGRCRDRRRRGAGRVWAPPIEVVRRGGRVVVVGMYAAETVELQLGVDVGPGSRPAVRGGDAGAGDGGIDTMDGLAAGDARPGAARSAIGCRSPRRRRLCGVRASGGDQGGARPVGMNGADGSRRPAFRELVEGLLDANLARVSPIARCGDPRREAAALVATDADVAVTIQMLPGARAAGLRCSCTTGEDPCAEIVVRAPGHRRCSSWPRTPLRLGLPDVTTARGARRDRRRCSRGRIRVRGLVRHLGTVRRLSMLLSAR